MNIGRVLRMVAVVDKGVVLGSALVCEPCLRDLTPLNPDPLTVEAA